MFFDQDLDFHFDTEQMLNDAVGEILRHEDQRQFFTWMRMNIRHYFDERFSAENLTDHVKTSLAIMFGYGIWNAMPLSANDYRPRPIPLPKRNDRCPCGSGKKYKKCCFTPVGIPSLDPEFLWQVVITKLPDSTLAKVIENNRVPLAGVVHLARNYLDDGKSKKVIALLEPFFTGKITRTGHDAAMALDVLCDAYLALNYARKKKEIIACVVEQAKKSPLRGSAWQRLATVRMDDDDSAGAWEAFHKAQRDLPGEPSMGLLEVELLLCDRKIELVKERAAFWWKRLLKMGIPEDDPACRFFQAAKEDPVGMQVDMEMEAADGAGIGLKQWLEEVSSRPVPVYELIRSGPEDDQPSPASKRRELEAAGQMSLPFPEPSETSAPDFVDDDEEEDEDILIPPENILRVQIEWCDVLPLAKPFSIHFTSYGEEDPWDVFTELEWTEFLVEHPEAYDSIDILDDLATALEMNPDFSTGWTFTTMIEPILLRSRAIVEKTVAARKTPIRLSWLVLENRPALRNLVRLFFFYLDKEMEAEAMQLAEWLLELNPGDNHGLRSQVINYLLEQGKNQEVLELAVRYPDDILPETVLGRVLALYRLKHFEEATEELVRAMDRHATSIKYLWRARVKKPRLDVHGVSIGGPDQAWLYREAMREVWQAEPGALEWLKKESKKHC